MTTISAKAKGTREVTRALDHTFLAALARNRQDALIAAGNALVAEIRRGRWFDNDRGRLKSQLFVGKPRMTKLTGAIDVGWGGPSAAYGPVLEPPGPDKKSWTITPKNTSAGTGKPLRALRWVSGGRVIYAKRVERKWSPKSLRPHFKPALERSQRKIDAIFDDAISGAAKAAGLQ